jgi:HAD superfamily hydrolase (TIGR01509 family)
MPVRAVLFDLDGTLVDNMSIHIDAWAAVAQQHGVPAPRERIAYEWAGRKNEELVPLMMGREVPPDEIAQISQEKETRYRDIASKVLAETPGAGALLQRLRDAGLKLAVATAAPEENRRLALDGALNLGRFFDAVIGPEGVRHGKPAPDIFLKSAGAVSVAPPDCIVFEDAPNGVRAGVAAGMRVAGVTTMADAAALTAAGATWTLKDFRVLPESLERTLFGRADLP